MRCWMLALAVAGGCGVTIGSVHGPAPGAAPAHLRVGVAAGVVTGVAHVKLTSPTETFDFTPLETGAYLELVAHPAERFAVSIAGDALEFDGHGWQYLEGDVRLHARYAIDQRVDLFLGAGYGRGHTGPHIEGLHVTDYLADAGAEVELGTVGVPVRLRVEATAATGTDVAVQAIDGSLVFSFYR